MNFEDAYTRYLLNVKDYMEKNPQQRRGQAHFNVLYIMYPALGNQVRCTEIDAFHIDERLPYMLDFVYEALRRIQQDNL